MSDKRAIINLPGCGWVETVVVATIAGVGGLVAMLVIGLNQGKPAAFAIVGGLVTLALMALGGGLVIMVMWFSYMMERGREKREQERWTENAKENLAIMQGTARAQATQNQMLLRQARDLQRALPAPGDSLDLDSLVYDHAVFDELGD